MSKVIALKPCWIVGVLGTLALLLVLASVAGQWMSYHGGGPRVQELATFFDVDEEKNIPTFFCVFLLLLSALLLGAVSALERNRKASDAVYWIILSLGFVVIAVDELIGFHERLSKLVRILLGGSGLGVTSSWVVAGIVVVIALALFFLRFLLRLPAKTRRAFCLAAAFYVGGCVGLEMVGVHYYGLTGGLSLTYKMITTVEEVLEMAGIILFIRGLLAYLADHYPEVRVRFDEALGDVTPDGPA